MKRLLRICFATLLLIGPMSTAMLADGALPPPTCTPGSRKC